MARPVLETPSASRQGRIASWTAAMAWLVIGLAKSATAQTDDVRRPIDSPGLSIEAIAGWDGTVDRWTPIPVSLMIRNDSDQIIAGEIRLSDPIRGYEATLGEVVLAPKTSRRLGSIQGMTDWSRCIVTLTAGETILWRRELALATGSEFDPNFHFALFIDGGGRRLDLPGARAGAQPAEDPTLARKEGRPVKCLAVKPWQVPTHPGPCAVAQAIVFPEAADEAELNPAQWQAIADWMCQGGTVFVHQDSQKLIERLIGAAPLPATSAVSSGSFTVRRVGLGELCEFPQALFSEGGAAIRQEMEERIAKLRKNDTDTMLQSITLYGPGAGRADLNRGLVMALFGFYMLLIGGVSLLLFRLSQRRIAIYAIVVVTGTSLLAAMLGGYLRLSRGDLRWITVTQPAAEGAVQWGRIEAQSAGGRNTAVAIHGPRADLQVLSGAQHYWPWGPRPATPPFTWQPNLAGSEPDACRIDCRTTPWGVRRLRATAYPYEVRRLDFRLGFRPGPAPMNARGKPTQPTGMPSGTFSLTLANHLPFDITDCWILIGTTEVESAVAGGFRPGPPSSGVIAVSHRQQLARLAAGETKEMSFASQFLTTRNPWELSLQVQNGYFFPPAVSSPGAASAWFIGRIERSPGITIDEQHSEFDPYQQLHLFMQEIRPEDMPDPAVFPGTPAGKSKSTP